MNHYTEKNAFNAIHSQADWRFRAAKPPGDHAFGAYFTTLAPNEPHLARRLRIPRMKLAYVFSFVDVGDLEPLRGDRGQYVFYSRADYVVSPPRQTAYGETSCA